MSDALTSSAFDCALERTSALCPCVCLLLPRRIYRIPAQAHLLQAFLDRCLPHHNGSRGKARRLRPFGLMRVCLHNIAVAVIAGNVDSSAGQRPFVRPLRSAASCMTLSFLNHKRQR